MKDINPSAPVFVKVDDYNEIRDMISGIKQKIDSAKDTLAKAETLRAKEMDELTQWQHALDEIEQKVSHIDATLMQ